MSPPNSIPKPGAPQSGNLVETVKGVRGDTQAIRKLFSRVASQFGAISLELNGWNHFHPTFRPKISGFQKQWGEFQSRFISLLWKSHQAAGNSQALLTEFVEVSFPMLRGDSASLEKKKILLDEMIGNLKKHETISQETSTEFMKLREDMKLATANWRTIVEKKIGSIWTQELREMLDHLLTDLQSLSEETEKMNIVKVGHVLALITPTIMLPPRAETIFARGLSTFLQKLGTICNVWAAIRAELQQIRCKLEMQTSHLSNADPEAQKVLAAQYVLRLDKAAQDSSLLAQALQEYQHAVVE